MPNRISHKNNVGDEFPFLHNEKLGMYIFGLLCNSEWVAEGNRNTWVSILQKAKEGKPLSTLEQYIVRSIIQNERDNGAISSAFIKNHLEYNKQSQFGTLEGQGESWQIVDMVRFLEEFCKNFAKYAIQDTKNLSTEVSADVTQILKNSNGLPEMEEEKYIQERITNLTRIIQAKAGSLSGEAFEVMKKLILALSKTIPLKHMQAKIDTYDLEALSYLPATEDRLKQILLKKSISYENYPHWFIHIRKNELGKTLFTMLRNRLILQSPFTEEEMKEVLNTKDSHLIFAINSYQNDFKEIEQIRATQYKEVETEQKNRILQAQANTLKEALADPAVLVAFERVIDLGIRNQVSAPERLLFLSLFGQIIRGKPISKTNREKFVEIISTKSAANGFISMKAPCVGSYTKQTNGENNYDEALALIGKFFFEAEKAGNPIESYDDLLGKLIVESEYDTDQIEIDLTNGEALQEAYKAIIEEIHLTLWPGDNRFVSMLRDVFDGYRRGSKDRHRAHAEKNIVPILQKVAERNDLHQRYLAKYDKQPEIRAILEKDLSPKTLCRAFVDFIS